MKVDLVYIHSITVISTAPIIECTFFVCTLLICSKAYKALYQLRKTTDNTIEIRYFNFSQCFNILLVKEVTQLKMSTVFLIDVLF